MGVRDEVAAYNEIVSKAVVTLDADLTRMEEKVGALDIHGRAQGQALEQLKADLAALRQNLSELDVGLKRALRSLQVELGSLGGKQRQLGERLAVVAQSRRTELPKAGDLQLRPGDMAGPTVPWARLAVPLSVGAFVMAFIALLVAL